MERKWLWAHARARFPTAPTGRRRLYRHLLRARLQRKVPLQYLLGTQPFGSSDILCRAPVLVPRYDTETWVDRAIADLKQRHAQAPWRMLDLCTGTGCIAIELARQFPTATALGLDISPRAVLLARRNAIRNDVAERVQMEVADMLSLQHCVDLIRGRLPTVNVIVANPPYVLREEMAALPADVRLYEDHRALVGVSAHQNKDGWLYYKAVLQIASHLNIQTVFAEIGTQDLARLPCPEDYTYQLWRDDQDRPRCIHYERKEQHQ